MGFVHVQAIKPTDSLAYAGEVTAQKAWDDLKHNAEAMLIDVRTPPEWVFSGVPDISSLQKKLQRISWKLFPSFVVNDRFASTIRDSGIKESAPLFFLCRTGGRSLDAAIAMTAEGFGFCYNITDGFEGPLDASRHRGTIAGWKASNLPWEQE